MRLWNGQLSSNFRMIICGASSSGKSELLVKLLENENGILTSDFSRVIYLRGVETRNEARLREKFGNDLLVFDGIPKEEVLLPLCRSHKNTVLVMEDLEAEVANSELVAKIYSKYSHNYDFCVITTLQNVFRSGKERVNLLRNCTNIVCFPNNLDQSVIRLLAQRVYPQNPRQLVDLFDRVTSEPYAHLSFWANCAKELRFRSHIADRIQRVYVPDV